MAIDPRTLLLVAALAFSRAMDFFSTRVITPRLELEANPVMRRFGWGRMALLNAALLALPFVHQGFAITVIVASLLTAGTNLGSGALAAGMGERRQLESQVSAVRRLGLPVALALNTGGALLIGLGGVVLMVLAGDASQDAWWGGLGVAMFGLALLVHQNAALARLWRAGRARRSPKGPA